MIRGSKVDLVVIRLRIVLHMVPQSAGLETFPTGNSKDACNPINAASRCCYELRLADSRLSDEGSSLTWDNHSWQLAHFPEQCPCIIFPILI